MLDTSVAIALRDGDPDILARAAELPEIALLSIISVVELHGGVVRLPTGRLERNEALAELLHTLNVLPFKELEAAAYAAIIEALGFSRTRLIDRMIAAQAIVADATLATLNVRDFRAIPGLKLADWSGKSPLH